MLASTASRATGVDQPPLCAAPRRAHAPLTGEPTKHAVYLHELVARVRVALDELLEEQAVPERMEHDEASGHRGICAPTVRRCRERPSGDVRFCR